MNQLANYCCLRFGVTNVQRKYSANSFYINLNKRTYIEDGATETIKIHCDPAVLISNIEHLQENDHLTEMVFLANAIFIFRLEGIK